MRLLGIAADASFWCVACAKESFGADVERLRFEYPEDVNLRDTFGDLVVPYWEDLSHSDTPEHCTECGVFLDNRLTAEGEAYVKEAVLNGHGDPNVLATWREAYAYLFKREDLEEGMEE